MKVHLTISLVLVCGGLAVAQQTVGVGQPFRPPSSTSGVAFEEIRGLPTYQRGFIQSDVASGSGGLIDETSQQRILQTQQQFKNSLTGGANQFRVVSTGRVVPLRQGLSLDAFREKPLRGLPFETFREHSLSLESPSFTPGLSQTSGQDNGKVHVQELPKFEPISPSSPRPQPAHTPSTPRPQPAPQPSPEPVRQIVRVRKPGLRLKIARPDQPNSRFALLEPAQHQARPQRPQFRPEEEDEFVDEARFDEDLFRKQAESARYSFESSIHDSINDNMQTRSEVRDGLSLRGQYSYSDGFFKRTVHYEADENGYRVVKMETEPLSSEGPQFDPAGQAQVAANLGNSAYEYSITSDDIPSLSRRHPTNSELDVRTA